MLGNQILSMFKMKSSDDIDPEDDNDNIQIEIQDDASTKLEATKSSNQSLQANSTATVHQ